LKLANRGQLEKNLGKRKIWTKKHKKKLIENINFSFFTFFFIEPFRYIRWLFQDFLLVDTKIDEFSIPPGKSHLKQ
jgi:hypothetical protein